MPRVLFTSKFNWPVRSNVTLAYKACCSYPVTRACADAAIAAGKAVEVPAPQQQRVRRTPKALQ